MAGRVGIGDFSAPPGTRGGRAGSGTGNLSRGQASDGRMVPGGETCDQSSCRPLGKAVKVPSWKTMSQSKSVVAP